MILRPEPPVFDDARVAAEAAPTDIGPVCRRNFGPKPLPSMPPSVALDGRGFNLGLRIFDPAMGRGESRSYKKMVSVGGAFAPNPRLRWRRGRSETCSDNSEPLVLDDAKVAAKAAPTMRPSRTKRMMHPSPGVALGFFQPRSSVAGRSIHRPQDPLPPIPRRKRSPRPGNGSTPSSGSC